MFEFLPSDRKVCGVFLPHTLQEPHTNIDFPERGEVGESIWLVVVVGDLKASVTVIFILPL